MRKIFKAIGSGVLVFLVSAVRADCEQQSQAAFTNCMDLRLVIPPPLPNLDSPVAFFSPDKLRYMLSAFLAPGELPAFAASGELALPCGLLPSSAHQVFQASLRPDGRLNARYFGDEIAAPYLESRFLHHSPQKIPTELADFLRETSFLEWRQLVIPLSRVKKLSRVIYRSPRGISPRIFVAQTHESITGDLSAPVRETEIILEREDDAGNWDFYAYDKKGRLSPTSEFSAGQRPVPTTCLGCHYDTVSRTFGPRGH